MTKGYNGRASLGASDMNRALSNITDINSLKRENKLESDRGEVLRVAAQGGDLHTILNLLCEKSEA